jgi:hypothetical protein
MKIYPEESDENEIERHLSTTGDDEPLSGEELEGIRESLLEFKSGQSITHEEI